jgi:hypothetical protein
MSKSNTRPIPTSNAIALYFHCRKCFDDIPKGMSPSQWSRLEAGWTEIGLQIRCKRCDANILHVDFEGQKHPARTDTGGEEG